MGEEIHDHHFSKRDILEFRRRLREETELLSEYFREQRFASGHEMAGFELETCIVDHACLPRPDNVEFMRHAAGIDVTPELSRFNVELNTPPQVLSGNALSRMRENLQKTWDECWEAAAKIDRKIAMVGVLPSLRDTDLTLENMSDMERYRALNEQVFRRRKGRPLRLEVQGKEHLFVEHDDVMLEAATTSFQIHLKIDQADAVDTYNTSMLISAPVMAACANSPYVFGQELWDESRIPLFEQSVSVRQEEDVSPEHPRRVSFGSGYARDSLLEPFLQNLAEYPVLLPEIRDSAPEEFFHLRLHNGTVWRWNRPLIGFNEDGRPHLRVEHRVIPAGPSVPDSIANAALYYGLVSAYRERSRELSATHDFSLANDNFYAAARHGLAATMDWGGRSGAPIRDLLLDEFIPAAHDGLARLGLDSGDSNRYLGMIEERVHGGRNGSAWQRAWVEAHGRDMRRLTCAYLQRQESGLPVHEWDV